MYFGNPYVQNNSNSITFDLTSNRPSGNTPFELMLLTFIAFRYNHSCHACGTQFINTMSFVSNYKSIEYTRCRPHHSTHPVDMFMLAMNTDDVVCARACVWMFLLKTFDIDHTDTRVLKRPA